MSQENAKCYRTACTNPHDNCKHKQNQQLYCESCAIRINRANPEVKNLIVIPRLFSRHYSQWLNDCLVEYNSKVDFPRKYHQETLPDPVNYDPGDLVEFTEDGNAYPHSVCGTNYIPRMVTPWAESKHYIE